MADPPRILTATLQETPPTWTNRPLQVVDGVVGDISVFERSDIQIQLGFSKPVQQLQLEWIDWEPLTSSPAAAPATTLADGTRTPDTSPSSADPANPANPGTSNLLPEELAAAAAGTAMAGAPETSPIAATQPSPADPKPVLPEIAFTPDRLTALLRFSALGSGRFRFNAADEYGLANNTEPDRRLIVTPDAPPVLTVTGVTDGLEVRPDDIVPLNCLVTDDVGVGLLELHVRRNQDAVRVIPAVPLDHGSPEVNYEFRVDLQSLAVKQDDTVEFRVRAADERQIPGPQVVWKGPWSIRIRDNAEALGQQALKQADQQLIDSLKAMSEQLGKDATTAAQLRDQATRDWNENARQEARGLSEKDQTQGNELQKLAEQTGEHPLMQKQAAKLAELAQNVRQNVPELLDKATAAERDPAAQNLQQASHELNRSRDELNRTIEEIQRAAQLEQDLADLNRLALDAEKLADDSEKFQQQRKAGPEAGQQPEEFNQQLAQERQRLQQKQQEVSGDLNNLLQRKQELLQAAREAQLDRAAEAARQLQELASRQQKLAEGVNEEARDAARDAQEIANQLQQARNDAEQLGREIQQQDQAVPKPTVQPLDDALRELRQGNLEQPQQNIHDVSQQLENAAQQLNKPQQPKSPENAAKPDTANPAAPAPLDEAAKAAQAAEQQKLNEQNAKRQELAQKAGQLEERLNQLNEQVRELAENRGAQPKQGDPPQGQPQEGQPQQGDPQQGDPQLGDPQLGQPQEGQPQQGDPQQGDPQQGQPQEGQPQQGDPQQGQPQANPSRQAAENMLRQIEQIADAAREQADALQNAPAAPQGARTAPNRQPSEPAKLRRLPRPASSSRPLNACVRQPPNPQPLLISWNRLLFRIARPNYDSNGMISTAFLIPSARCSRTVPRRSPPNNSHSRPSPMKPLMFRRCWKMLLKDSTTRRSDSKISLLHPAKPLRLLSRLLRVVSRRPRGSIRPSCSKPARLLKMPPISSIELLNWPNRPHRDSGIPTTRYPLRWARKSGMRCRASSRLLN
ncbi:MAG UNVERIFIED_CONTAM: hypothetical protein LVR18_41645 [Planctomycetaceae bacterium]